MPQLVPTERFYSQLVTSLVTDRLSANDPTDYDDFLFEYKQSNENAAGLDDLWLGVLSQALWDYKSTLNTGDFKEVFDWFFGDHQNYVGSFSYVCNVLNIQSDPILKSLIKWTRSNRI